MEFAEFLRSLGACDEAIEFVEDMSISEAWELCEDGEWMLWLCRKMQKKKGWPTEQDIKNAFYLATVDMVFAFFGSFEYNSMMIEKYLGGKPWVYLTISLKYPFSENQYTRQVMYSHSMPRTFIYYALKAVNDNDMSLYHPEKVKVRKYMADVFREHLWVGEID